MATAPKRSPLEPLSTLIARTGLEEIHKELISAYPSKSIRYLTDLQRRTSSLNEPIFDFFDEAYYLMNNRDVLDHLFAGGIDSGLRHFLGWGIYEGRVPVRASDLSRISDHLLGEAPVKSGHGTNSALSFDELCDLLHFVPDEVLAKCYIKEPVTLRTGETHRLPTPIERFFQNRPWLNLVLAEFDEVFYAKQSQQRFKSKFAAFQHYIDACRTTMPNPNSEFDEAFYRSFHYDVNAVIEKGELICGFEHYIISGRKEQRVPRYDAVATLEAVIPGVTDPVGLSNVDDIEKKVTPCPHRLDRSRRPTVWIIVPFLYTDVMFGGFASFIEFIERLLAQSVRCGLFIKDAPSATLGYFKFRSPDRLLTKRLNEIEVYSPIDSGREFAFSPRDLFICYSNWDGLWGIPFAAKTEFGKPIFWIQELEAIFFSYDSRRFVMNSVYLNDHIGIFNSEFLRKYFIRERIGVYRDSGFADRRSLSYEHVLQFVGQAKPGGTKPKHRRRLLLYTRPEGHAARNLFEVSIVALRLALKTGVFDDSWEFKGIGSLGGPYTVELTDDVTLDIIPKMSLDEYREFIQDVDIGMSLMYAPHPSLLPYEFALTGAVVVTNNFEERGPDYFSRYGDNIISFDCSVEKCAEAICRAVLRVTAPGYTKTRPKFAPRTWKDVFSDEFFDRLAGIGVDFSAYKTSAGKGATEGDRRLRKMDRGTV